jgi:thiol-disulfide isomerase/thioredoxin
MRDLGAGATVPRNRPMVRFLRGCALSLAVLALIWAGSAGAGLAVEQRRLMAPPFSHPDLDGRTRTLTEFLGAKPVLLEFMSTDCPHCRDMAPVLTRLHDVYGNRVVFLTVAFDRRAARVKAFAQTYGHPWCYLLGNEETAREYALQGVPTFVLLGPDGRIRGVQVGACPYDEFARAIEGAFGAP